MTATKKSAADVKLPSQEQASEVAQAVFADAYFAKLASFGYVPQNREEADAYLSLADKAIQLAQHPAVKQAELAASPVLRLNAQLDQYMVQSGIQKQAEAQANDAHLNQLSLSYASDPAVYASMLSLNIQE